MELLYLAFVVGFCGAAGGFVNVFIGDNGLHLPKVNNGVFLPGFLGNVFIGGLAALGSWGAAKAIVIYGAGSGMPTFSTGDIANALMIGFGGAKWFKTETDKTVLQETAAIAARKSADPDAAMTIAKATPTQALAAALQMPR